MNDQPKNLFEISVDTRMLYDLLSKAPVGETVTFARMSEALGRRVEGADSHLQSALRRLVSLDQKVFSNVRGVGYQRLSDTEIVKSGERDRDHIQRSARKAAKRLLCVEDFDALPNDLKVKHNTYLSMYGAMVSMLSPGRVKNLESEVSKAQAQLPLAKTLEAFII